MNTHSDIDAPTVSAVELKLPPFWPADAELWFIHVEAQFTARRITADLTRCHHIVSSFPPATASEFRDLLLAPPAENTYQTLKETLIRCFTPSEPERLRQLLYDTDLGDRTPSQLLRHMLRLVGSVRGLDGTLLCEIFLQRLPSNVRGVLDTVAEKDYGKMAAIADTIMAAANPSASVANVQVESASAPSPNELLEFREEIARLTETVTALQARASQPLEQRMSLPTPGFTPSTTSAQLTVVVWFTEVDRLVVDRDLDPGHFLGVLEPARDKDLEALLVSWLAWLSTIMNANIASDVQRFQLVLPDFTLDAAPFVMNASAQVIPSSSLYARR
ncbi:hypothetical protein HPB49_009408 [Dermacentor silvarum]|uniref:Uncharacterized protein n=1 Tax=Dermacentor silvarum TaxID=543639 RepID=A0ACB8DYU1_DERSI|nr:hypothetical protein HPB49_009408 [Dermacentor silvarum]